MDNGPNCCMSLQKPPERGRTPPFPSCASGSLAHPGNVPSQPRSVSCLLQVTLCSPRLQQGPLLPVATATSRGKNSARLAESFWKFAKLCWFSVLFCYVYIHIYIFFFFLVKICYSFFNIFAWKPRNFEVILSIPASLGRHLSFKPRQKEHPATQGLRGNWEAARRSLRPSRVIGAGSYGVRVILWHSQLLEAESHFHPQVFGFCQITKAFQ